MGFLAPLIAPVLGSIISGISQGSANAATAKNNLAQQAGELANSTAATKNAQTSIAAWQAAHPAPQFQLGAPPTPGAYGAGGATAPHSYVAAPAGQQAPSNGNSMAAAILGGGPGTGSAVAPSAYAAHAAPIPQPGPQAPPAGGGSQALIQQIIQALVARQQAQPVAQNAGAAG